MHDKSLEWVEEVRVEHAEPLGFVAEERLDHAHVQDQAEDEGYVHGAQGNQQVVEVSTVR